MKIGAMNLILSLNHDTYEYNWIGIEIDLRVRMSNHSRNQRRQMLISGDNIRNDAEHVACFRILAVHFTRFLKIL